MWTKAQAQREILRAWRALPDSERLTEAQAAAFAMQIKDAYPFRCKGDRYQVIKGWLQSRLATSH